MVVNSTRPRVAALAAVALAAALAAIPGLRGPAASATVLTCGTQPSPSAVYKTCAFFDDFNGTALDSTKWRPIDSSATAPVAPNGTCLRGTQVTVGSGKLHLLSQAVATPITCWVGAAGPVNTRLIGGGVTTDTKFAKTYGRIEYRAAFPADDTYSWTALWMSPDNNTYNPGGPVWPYNGEIDIAERYWGTPTIAHTSLHYADKSGATSFSTGDRNPGETRDTCTVATPAAYHTYSAEWTSTRVVFYVDNVQCASLGWDPANVSPPAPFDRPFNLVATQTIVEVGSQPPAPAGTSRQANIEWVKYWS